MGRQLGYLCIIVSMSKYVYQIQGALVNPMGKFLGLRVLVGSAEILDIVDVPVEVFAQDTVKYLQFRLSITAERLVVQTLPTEIQNSIKAPLGRWLDHWVLENFYGDNSNRKGPHIGLVEAGSKAKGR